ncbi:MAG: lycopene cyclase domain-containing protein [Candidatus Microsaccharimonas sp.]
MAFTYLILNIVFIVCIVVVLGIVIKKPSKSWLITLGVLMVLTLVFDNVIVGTRIVGYDTSKLLGIYLGVAPVEDFFYALLAVIIVPFLWKKFSPIKPGKVS